MQDLKILEKLERDARRAPFSQKRTSDDLPRLEACDIPDSGELPNGGSVKWGAYRHRALPTGVVTVRWMVQCPLCRRPCRVLYDLDGQYMCRHCTGLPYRSSISGRVVRAAVAMVKHPERYQEIQTRLIRDCEHDAANSERRYRRNALASRHKPA